MNMSASGTRILWKPDEQRLLTERVALLIFKGEVDNPLQAMRAAQSVLPPHRRRDVKQLGGKLPWFHSGLSKELARLRRQVEQGIAIEVAKPMAQQQSIAQPPTTQTTHLNGSAATVPQTPHLNGSAATEAPPAAQEPHLNGAAAEVLSTVAKEAFFNLRAMLVDELASVFVEAALKAMGSPQFGGEPFVRIDKPEADATTQPRVVFQRQSTARKPVILVVGLKGSQKTEIQRDYGARFDLRFVGSDESKDLLRSMADKAERTILMTDFISHSHEDIVKARSPNYIRRSGGLTQLRDALAGLVQ